MVILSNAFSLNMLQGQEVYLKVTKVSTTMVKDMIRNGFQSVVGHQSTADYISTLLETDVPLNRANITLGKGEKILVLQLKTRLPEGKILTKEEVSEIPHEWVLVEVL